MHVQVETGNLPLAIEVVTSRPISDLLVLVKFSINVKRRNFFLEEISIVHPWNCKKNADSPITLGGLK